MYNTIQTTVQQVNIAAILPADDINDVAAQWGKQDALDGEPCFPGVFFDVGSAAYNAYREAYDLAVMDRLSAAIRAGASMPPVRLTDEQLDEIEAERPDSEYVPFQQPAEYYRDAAQPAEYRDDYVGA